MADYGAEYGLSFLKFQLEQSDNKEVFLKYLQTAIPHRKNNYPKEKHERLDYCLAWVNEEIFSIKDIQHSKATKDEHTAQSQLAVINHIQIQNEANSFVAVDENGNKSMRHEITELKSALEKINNQIKGLNCNSNTEQQANINTTELDNIIERLERVDKAIGLFEFGQIETFSEDELKQFVFLLLALQSYQLNNYPKSKYFFTRLTKIDITKLLKSNFKYYNDKAFKTVEKDVNKFDETLKEFDLTKIHKDLKKMLGNFNE